MNARIFLCRVLAAAAVLACLTCFPALAQTIRYVNAAAAPGGNGLTWATAYQTIPPAVAAAQPGDEVWVAQATYPAPAAGYVINKRISLYGGFKGTELDHDHRLGSFLLTILEGNLGGGVNAQHVITTTGVLGVNGGPGLLIDGFLIQNGLAAGAGVNGAGILATQTDLDLANLFVRHNYAPGLPGANPNYGGGLYFTSFVAGIAPPTGYQLRIKNCEFSDNTGSYGGGIFADRARGQIVNAQFLNDRAFPFGGGVYVTRNGSGSRLDFTNCTFWSNSCSVNGIGGAMYLADAGAGAGGNVKIVNCTFSDNSGNLGTDGQALVVSSNSSAEIHNSIFYWNNSNGSGTPAPILGSATITYSLVEGGWVGGSHILIQDPLFVDHSIGRLRLVYSPSTNTISPCIDAADYSQLPADALDVDLDGNHNEPVPLDLDGQLRLVDKQPPNDTGVGSSTGAYACPLCTYLDMGAYERQ